MSLDARLRLNAEDLQITFPDNWIPWSSTREIPCCERIIGQERALRAIRLGLDLKSDGYNIFVTGLSGTGKMTTVHALLKEINHSARMPGDLCYVYNFKHPDAPRLLALPAGYGKRLKSEMNGLLANLKTHVPFALESGQFKSGMEKLLEHARAEEKDRIRSFENRVSEMKFALVQVQYNGSHRPELMPVIAGNPMSMVQLEQLVDEGKFESADFEQIKLRFKQLAGEMADLSRALKNLQQEIALRQQQLIRDAVSPALDEALAEIKRGYPAGVLDLYLAEVREDLLDKTDLFREKVENKPDIFSAMMAPKDSANPLLPFEVNLLVDNSDTKGIPIIIETSPNYRNLFGAIEKIIDRGGSAQTDFTRIRAGSLLQANGGYLVINANDALLEPEVWKNLKRALKYHQVSIQSYDPFFISSVYLKPEEISIDVKIVMVGDKEIYQLLYGMDEDFKKIFKVLADFDSVMANNPGNVADFASLMRKVCDEEDLLAFDRDGIKAVLKQAVRAAGRKNKITTRFSDVADIMREAHFWAVKEQAGQIGHAQVERAVREKTFRHDLPEERIREYIAEGMIYIDTDGWRTGQVNGLSVLGLGYYAFGQPNRITAEVSVGREGVLNIEREAGLSGRTHDKGVLILSGFLRSRYTKDKPLGINASLCFEQSYGGVDGDSASSTELYALLSALAELPVRQDLAVTGSVNQKGQVQPIGGVNEKVEGFFEVCAARGLTGRQGVLIPRANVDDLVLRDNVVEAVRTGQFSLWAVETVDEGIELLTGVPAGERQTDGGWPAGSVNEKVNRRLQQFAETLKNYRSE